jgi:anti-sigma B factor antagonist
MAHIDLIRPVGPRHDAPNCCSAEPLTVSTEPSGAVVVALSGEVDMTNCAALRDRIIEPLRSTHHLVLDLSEMTFLCAAGLTVLVDVSAAARSTGTRLCVVARTRPVRLPLMITGLSGVLDLHLDVEEALACRCVNPAASPAGPRLGDPRQPGDLR